MKLIIPMAGMGKRLRPHTLTIPKPLVYIAGKSIVERLIENITNLCKDKIEEINFVVSSDFGEKIENNLKNIAKKVGAEPKICYQEEPLGTAHAILCAEESLKDNVIIAFADTLFYADFKIKKEKDGVFWVKEIDDPKAFGVIKTNKLGEITDFVEKPKTFVSNMAMIGIYYFKKGEILRKELQYLIDNNIMQSGEYQLPHAMKNMLDKGMTFAPAKVQKWLDCGNKNGVIETSKEVLKQLNKNELIDENSELKNTTIINPCYISKNVKIQNSVIGPYASIHKNTTIKNSIIENTIIYKNSNINRVNLKDSIIGNFNEIKSKTQSYSTGDYTKIEEN